MLITKLSKPFYQKGVLNIISTSPFASWVITPLNTCYKVAPFIQSVEI